MVITLTPQLEAALSEQARRRGVAPETLALEALRERFLPAPALEPRDEWERRLLGLAKDCGVSLSDEALSLRPDVLPKLFPLLVKRPDVGSLVKRHAVLATVPEELLDGDRLGVHWSLSTGEHGCRRAFCVPKRFSCNDFLSRQNCNQRIRGGQDPALALMGRALYFCPPLSPAQTPPPHGTPDAPSGFEAPPCPSVRPPKPGPAR